MLQGRAQGPAVHLDGTLAVRTTAILAVGVQQGEHQKALAEQCLDAMPLAVSHVPRQLQGPELRVPLLLALGGPTTADAKAKAQAPAPDLQAEQRSAAASLKENGVRQHSAEAERDVGGRLGVQQWSPQEQAPPLLEGKGGGGLAARASEASRAKAAVAVAALAQEG